MNDQRLGATDRLDRLRLAALQAIARVEGKPEPTLEEYRAIEVWKPDLASNWRAVERARKGRPQRTHARITVRRVWFAVAALTAAVVLVRARLEGSPSRLARSVPIPVVVDHIWRSPARTHR